MDDFAGSVVPLRRGGTDRSTTAARGSRSSAPAPAASRSRRPSPTTSSSSPCSSAPRSGCSPTRTTTARCPTASAGRSATCRSTGAGSGSSPSIRVPGSSIERSRIDPDYDDGGLAISETNRATREMFARADARAARRRRRARGEGDPRLPGDRQAHAAGQRLVAGVPAQGQRRARPHRHRAHRRRRRRHRRRHLPSRRRHLLRHRLPAQRLPLADADHRPRREWSCASSGATSPPPTSASR